MSGPRSLDATGTFTWNATVIKIIEMNLKMLLTKTASASRGQLLLSI